MNENGSTKYRQLSLLLFSVSIVLGSVSINFAELRLGTYGLIHSLPPTFFVALFLLTLSFLITIRFNAEDRALLCLHLIALLVLLYFLPAMIERTAKFEASYHVYGHTDYILRHGQANSAFSDYQYWPGLLYLGAAVIEITGLSPTTLLMYFPIAFELICFPILYLLLKSLVQDHRIVWIALWIYYAAGWVHRAYYSSQASGYLLLLAILFLTSFWILGAIERRGVGKGHVLLVLVVLFAAIVMTHLLSSIVALICLAIFYALSRAKSAQHLNILVPVLLAGMMAVWLYSPLGGYLSGTVIGINERSILLISIAGLICLAIPYTLIRVKLTKRLYIIVSALFAGIIALAIILANLWGIFDLRQIYTSTVEFAFGGGGEHSKVMYIKAIFTTAFCALALIGVLYAIFRRGLDFRYITALGLLTGTCSIIVVVGSYSGEIIYRIFQFALPFLAILAAKNYLSGRVLSTLLVLFMVAAPALFVATAYGNEKAHYISPAEIAGTEFFYDHAPENSKVHSLTQRIWDFKYIEREYWEPLALAPTGASENDPENSSSNTHYVLIGERDIEAATFSAGNVDVDKLDNVSDSPYYNKVYSCDGFQLFKRRGGQPWSASY